MLTEQEIQTIIEAQDMKLYWRNEHGKKGNGISRVYVRVYKRVDTHDIWFDLGRIEAVRQMSQDELVEAIKQKFAEKFAEKLAGKSRAIESAK